MSDEYVASYGSAIMPVLAWVTSNDWVDTFMTYDAEFYSELVATAGSPVEEILGMLPSPLFARAHRCVFDDFLVSEYEGTPSNVLDAYLSEVGSELEKEDVDFLTAFRTSVVRLYHVEDRIPYETVTLRELSGGARAIQIEDIELTGALSAGDTVATRILTYGDRDYLAGPILVLTADVVQAFQQAFEQTLKDYMRGLEKYLQKDPRQRTLGRQRILTGAASVVAGMWVTSTIATLSEALPDVNEGDPETPFTADMPYALPVEPIVECLNSHPDLRRPFEREFFWLWLTVGANPKPTLKAMVWITEGSLCVECWDPETIQEVVGTLSALLGDAVGEATIEEYDGSDEFEDDDDDDKIMGPMSDEDESAFRDRVHQFLDNRFRSLLDAPVPDLNERIPRELAKTVKGQKQLKKWLESQEDVLRTGPDKIGFSDYDLGWMWKELGMEGHRQTGLFE